MRCVITAGILALLGSTPPLTAEEAANDAAIKQAPTTEARLAAAVDRLEREGFSGFAAIARPGEPIFLTQAGAADPATGRKYDLDTQFDIGSISKSMTGLAAAKLISEGKLDPQARLVDFFAEVPADKRGITVHQLLTHTAGFGPAHGFDLQPMSRDEMLAEVLASKLLSEPGTTYAYSNMGFSLVAAIMEKITGRSYEAYLVEEVLRPIGLTSTGYRLAYDAALADSSKRHGPVAKASWGDLAEPSWALVGNGGLVSSARDLLALGQAIASKTLDPEIARIWTTQRVDEGGGTRYGYGIGWQNIDGLGDIYWHNGGNPAFQTEWWTLADSGITIVVHRNGGPLSLAQALGPVISAATGKELAFADGSPNVDLTPGDDLPDDPPGNLARGFLGAISGTKDDWSAFVQSRMSAKLLAQMPLEEHVAQYPMLHDEIASRKISGFGFKDGEIHLNLVSEEYPPMMLVLFYEVDAGQPQLNGIGIM